MGLIPLPGTKGYPRPTKYLHDVKIVHLKTACKGQHVEIPYRSLGFQRQEHLASTPRHPEDSLTNHFWVGIAQSVHALQGQAGHANVVGVGKDQGNRQPASPVLNDNSLFTGENLPSSGNGLPPHEQSFIQK